MPLRASESGTPQKEKVYNCAAKFRAYLKVVPNLFGHSAGAE
jgi:hypothetical protein